MASEVASVVGARGASLMAPPPARPVQHGFQRVQDAHHEPIDQPADLRHGEWDQFAVFGQLRQERPPLSAAPGERERTTAR